MFPKVTVDESPACQTLELKTKKSSSYHQLIYISLSKTYIKALLEVKLPFEPVYPSAVVGRSVGRLVGWSVIIS